MDRLKALRDTASLPRAVAPPTFCPGSSTGMERSLNDSGLDMRMDDSLTDMQWLQRMDAGSEIPGFVQRPTRKQQPKSDKENQLLPKLSKDGCRKRLHYDTTTMNTDREGEKIGNYKPPLSYASLIVLAISSSPQRMLTLSGIYRWIESTFPFYRTPESKAWKNSIRHNLSIRKNMFTKVCQYPPRRGNGSYWTLLSDGEDELTKAHPLFTTLLPPVIDPDSVYCRVPLTHTVKSRGQFVPVVPQTERRTPCFVAPATELGNPGNYDVDPVVTRSSAPSEHSRDAEVAMATRNRRATGRCPNKSSESNALAPKHLTEHSYSRTVTFEPELQMVEEELAPEDMVEGSFVLHSIPGMESGQATFTDNNGLQVGECDSTTDIYQCATPTHSDHAHFDSAHDSSVADCSLTSLFGSSFLTPTKMAAMSEINPETISFSPLYNFVTPQRGGTPPYPTATTMSSRSENPHTRDVTPKHRRGNETTKTPPTTNESGNSNIPIPVPISDCNATLSHSHSDTGTGVPELDSGIFSPFPTSLPFSTPLLMNSISPLVDLPGNVFNTPQSSEGLGTTPSVTTVQGGVRCVRGGSCEGVNRKVGSRQLFPCAYSTPPTS